MPTPLPTATPDPGPGLDAAEVQLFPWPLYAGDRVSVDVDPRLPVSMSVPLTLTLALHTGEILTAPVTLTGLDEQYQARLYWAWSMPDMAGEVPLTFTLLLPPGVPDPDLSDNVLPMSFWVSATETLLPPEPDAQWTFTETQGFRLHYLTGTAAERDLSAITVEAASVYSDVVTHFEAPETPLNIYLVDRVIGQGGYASSAWIAVSYTDRMYAPITLDTVLRHELVHRLDQAIGCDAALPIVREGLAVYISGGHYRTEPVLSKAAAIATTDYYVPLARLLEDFYVHQHEVSYAEAGAWVAYVVETFGWDGLERLCRAASVAEGDDAQRLAAGLEALAAPALDDFEAAWLQWLGQITPMALPLLDAEIHLMDTMRAYQRMYDPVAHFLDGILFSPEQAEQANITADFIRRPRAPEPVALELMLTMAQEAIRQGDAARVEAVLDVVDQVLLERRFAQGLAADTLDIVRTSLDYGYEPYRLGPDGEGGYFVYVLDRVMWPTRCVLVAMSADDGEWRVIPLALAD